jgi:hypothetical protein
MNVYGKPKQILLAVLRKNDDRMLPTVVELFSANPEVTT